MFKKYDEDGSGTISLDEFKTAFIGKQISDKQWNKIISEIDQDGSGSIDFQEFKDMMCSLIKAQKK